MDPVAPVEPLPEDGSFAETGPLPPAPGTSPEDGDADPHAQPSGALSNGASRASQGQLPSTSDPLTLQSPTQLYSPTKHEIESHPIVQRRSLVRDDISSGFGRVPPEESDLNEPRQAPPLTQRTIELPLGAMADTQVKEGDQVSWQWSGGRPGGEASEVKEQGEVSITTHRGNEVKKNAEPNNPAVKVSRSGNDVVKKASELAVDEPGDKHKEAQGEEKTGTDADKNGEAQTGDKRKADDAAEEKEDDEADDAKKQKTGGEPKENGDKAPKKKGRPGKKAANGEAAPKKETKKREPKKAATESGEPRRSGRHATKSS